MTPAGRRLPLDLRWLAMVLAAFVSLTWQSLVVQTHVHAALPTVGAGTGATTPSLELPRRSPAPDTPTECPLCRQLADSGTFLLPASPAIVPAAAAILAFRVEALSPWQGRRRSHAWHSRGPPGATPPPHP